MVKVTNLLFILFVLVLLFSTGCADNGVNKQEEYNKCTAVCASVLGEDFVTLKLCMDECKEKFLDKE